MSRLRWTFDDNLCDWAGETVAADGGVGLLVYSVVKKDGRWTAHQMLTPGGVEFIRDTADDAMKAADIAWMETAKRLGIPASPGEGSKPYMPPVVMDVWDDVSRAIDRVKTSQPDNLGRALSALEYEQDGMRALFKAIGYLSPADDPAAGFILTSESWLRWGEVMTALTYLRRARVGEISGWVEQLGSAIDRVDSIRQRHLTEWAELGRLKTMEEACAPKS